MTEIISRQFATVEATDQQLESLDLLGRSFQSMGERVASESRSDCSVRTWQINQDPNDLKLPVDYPCQLKLSIGRSAADFMCQNCQCPDVPADAARRFNEQIESADTKVRQILGQ